LTAHSAIVFPTNNTYHCPTLYRMTHKFTCLTYSPQQILYTQNRVTDSSEIESSIISQRTCDGKNPLRICHMVAEWPKPHYTTASHKITLTKLYSVQTPNDTQQFLHQLEKLIKGYGKGNVLSAHTIKS